LGVLAAAIISWCSSDFLQVHQKMDCILASFWGLPPPKSEKKS
jgi:hypothetical protein